MIDQHSLNTLGRLGRLLDEAIDLADASGETLLAAQIAQTLHQLDARLSALRSDLMAREHRPANPSGFAD